MIPNRYHTAEPWAPAQPTRRAVVRVGDNDLYVLGALVVIHRGDGRVVLAICHDHRRRSSRCPAS